jgi:hypothetical protein
MGRIREYDAGDLGLRPTETGVDARAASARRIGAFYNQVAGATEVEARATGRLASETTGLGRETERLGGETAQFGRETARLGSETTNVGREFALLGRETGELGTFKQRALVAQGRAASTSLTAAGGVALAYMEHQDISHGSLALAGLIAGKTRAWNDTTKDADPNDTTVGQRFLQDNLEPDLEKFKQGFLTEHGQKWAEAHADALRQHMVQKTSADMSQMAYDAAIVNHQQTVNALSATVHDDPSSLDFALKTLESVTATKIASSPNITGTQASKLHNELMQRGAEAIVKSAVIGHIAKTGSMPEWASDPKYAPFINGAEMKQFETYAKAQARANLLTQKQIEQYQKFQQTEAAHAELSKNFTDNVSFDENGKATVKPEYFKNVMDIEHKYPGMATERAKAMINFAQQQQREKRETIITDKPTQSALYEGLFRTENPTSDVDILRAANEHKLDPHDTSALLQLHKALEESPLKGPIYKDTISAVKGILGDGPKGHEAFAKFIQTFIPEYIKQQRAGTAKPNALDLRDENSLISQSLKPYRLAPKDMILDHLMKGQGGADAFGGGGLSTTPAFVAPSNWEWSASRRQYRDPFGNLYDASGNKVKQ